MNRNTLKNMFATTVFLSSFSVYPLIVDRLIWIKKSCM